MTQTDIYQDRGVLENQSLLLYGLNTRPPNKIALTLEVLGDITATSMVSREPIAATVSTRKLNLLCRWKWNS